MHKSYTYYQYHTKVNLKYFINITNLLNTAYTYRHKYHFITLNNY